MKKQNYSFYFDDCLLQFHLQHVVGKGKGSAVGKGDAAQVLNIKDKRRG